jgi:hypothetical protein
MPMMKPRSPSRHRARSGAGAWFMTAFALIWNVVVWALLVPSEAPGWFKGVFALAGGLVVWAAVTLWRQRIQGCDLDMQLTDDPVPHGVPVVARFMLGKPLVVDRWSMEVLVETSEGPQSGFGRVWSADFPVTAEPTLEGGVLSTRALQANFVLPVDVPSTQDRHFRISITVKGDALTWHFSLRSRPATASELATHQGLASSVVNGLPVAASAESLAHAQRVTRLAPWFRWSLYGLSLCVWGWGAWHFVWPFFDDRTPSSTRQAETAPFERSVSTQVDTAPFAITVTNWLVDDWRYRAHLEAQAQVIQGQLRVRVKQLSLMPVSRCQGADDCQIESVGLLLSREGAKNFSTLAESAPLPWKVDLASVRRATRHQGEWVMALPEHLPLADVRLKLVVTASRKHPKTGQTESTWVYPSHGNHLALHRALAQAEQQAQADQVIQDPCDGIASAQDAVKAACNERLSAMLGGQSQGELDALLVDAVTHFNPDAVPLLLQAGASPNASVVDRPGYTVLGMAASGNQTASVAALLKAGAQVNHRQLSDSGVVIMPLTQALRRDAAATVDLLLQAGATLDNDDPKGWTVMHIAAYEGASESIPLLVKAGANVNERTPADRQQIPLHTALQHAPVRTIEALLAAGASLTETDRQGENACGWARFFKRTPEVQRLVCPPPA